jgi:hypothetical protein
MTFTTTLTREDKDVTVSVEYEYTPGCRGTRDSLGGVAGAGPALEPDEGPEVEILSAEMDDGNALELTEYEISSLEELAMENVCLQIAERLEEKAERKAEQQRDDYMFRDDFTGTSGLEELAKAENTDERKE